MPKKEIEAAPYETKKQECKEIIGDLLGGMGYYPTTDSTGIRYNQNIIRSSREALKGIFKDQKKGSAAFEYLSGLKSSEGKSEEKQKQDSEKFQEIATNTQNLFYDNKRKFSDIDYLRPRVVGKSRARENAATTAMYVPLVAVLVPQIMIYSAMVQFDPNERERLRQSAEQRKLWKTVTKIDGDKKVNPKSSEVTDELKTKLRANNNTGLNYTYSDALFETLMGQERSELTSRKQQVQEAIDDAFRVEELVKQSKGTDIDVQSRRKAAILKVGDERSSATQKIEPRDVSKTVASFLTGEDVENTKFAQRVSQAEASEYQR